MASSISVSISADSSALQANLALAQAQLGDFQSELKSTAAAVAAAGGALDASVSAALQRLDAQLGQLKNKLAEQTDRKVVAGAADKNASSENIVAAWRGELEQKLAAERNFFADSRDEELAFWQSKLALASSGSRQWLEVQRTVYQLQRSLAQQQARDAEATAAQQARDAERVARGEQTATRAAYAERKITLEQETADLVAEENRRFAAVKEALESELAAVSQNVRQQKKLQQELTDAVRQNQKAIADIERQSAEQSRRSWEQALQPVSQSFSRTISGMLEGTATLRQGVANLAKSVITEMVDADVKRLTHWIATELAMTGATDAGNAARSASNTAARAGDAAGETLSTLGSITKHAASAAAAVYDDVAQIPVVGWMLAPPAAAAAFVAVVAFGSNLPSLDVGAWGLPADTMAQLHAGEMVVPADFASGLRGALAGGSGGGDTVIQVNFTNNGGGLTEALILQHSNTIARAVAKEIGNRSSTLWRAGR